MGSADGVSRYRARAGFFAPFHSAQNDKVLYLWYTLFCHPAAPALPCHPEERSDEGSRACAFTIAHLPLRGGSVPPASQSEAGGTGAHCAPLRGGTSPLHAAMAGGWQPFVGTLFLRAKRVLKGNGVIRKRGETAGVSPLARSAAAQAVPRPVGSGHALRPVGRIGKDGAPRSWPRPASLGPSVQFTFSRPTEDAAAQAAFPPAMHGQLRNAFQGEYERARARFFAAGCALRSE